MDAKSKANFINSVASGQKISCPNCNTLNDADSLFCLSCGTKLKSDDNVNDEEGVAISADNASEIHCPNCNTMNEAGSSFCLSCGTKLVVSSYTGVPVQESVQVGSVPAEAGTMSSNGKSVQESPAPAFAPVKKPTKGNASTGKRGDAMNQSRQQTAPARVAFQPVVSAVQEEPEEASVFAQGLPSWDIVPPQIMVRRKKR